MAGKFRARGVAIALVAGAAAVVLLGGVAAASVTAQPMAQAPVHCNITDHR